MIPGLGRSPGRAWQPSLESLLGEFQGQRSLAGYSPWGHKELDTIDVTEHSTHASIGNFLPLFILGMRFAKLGDLPKIV